jgi:hypothetical protein
VSSIDSTAEVEELFKIAFFLKRYNTLKLNVRGEQSIDHSLQAWKLGSWNAWRLKKAGKQSLAHGSQLISSCYELSAMSYELYWI